MPTCRVILHRHSEVHGVRYEPSDFVARKLVPMLEARVNGSAVHVIHDRVPCHPLDDDLIRDFEKALKVRKIIRHWSSFDRQWRETAKRGISSADEGRESVHITKGLSPETMLILSLNEERSGTIRNHLGFYPLEAAIENTRYRIHLELSRQMAGSGRLGESVSHMMAADDAMASCNLLRDIDIARQVALLGTDALVLRDLGHSYLARLDELEIPIAIDSHTVLNMADVFRKHGVHLEVIAEPVEPTFMEQAISGLCSGELDEESHRQLALLHILFRTRLSRDDLPEDREEMISIGRRDALFNLGHIYRDIFGRELPGQEGIAGLVQAILEYAGDMGGWARIAIADGPPRMREAPALRGPPEGMVVQAEDFSGIGPALDKMRERE